MQILVVTSRQLAPQEEWIFRGAKHLMEVSFQNSMNWVIYDTNPDLTEFDGTHFAHKRALVSNSFHHQSLKGFQSVVIAGGSRWAGSQTDSLYGLLAATDIPLFALGLQIPKSPRGLSEHELACFQRHTTVVTAIDSATKFFLSRYDLVPEILPCPSLFCSPGVEEKLRDQKPTFILQAEGSPNSTVTDAVSRALVSYAKRHLADFDYYCPTVDDYFRYSPLMNCKYVYDSAYFLDQLKHSPFIVTTDLTLAAIANAFLAPAILITSKTESPVKQMPFVFPTPLEKLDEKIQAISGKSFFDEIGEWKESVRRKWIAVLQGEHSSQPALLENAA